MVYEVTVQEAFDVCCYFAIDDESGHGVIIDPGAEGERLVRLIREKGWTIEKILLTHGHFDHIGGIHAIHREMEIPVWIHEEGRAYLLDPMLNLSQMFAENITMAKANYFRDGDEITYADGRCTLRVIHTPGHTRDSVLLYEASEGYAFSGDTIFRASVGNCMFPLGDERRMWKSIRERVFALPDETVLYPGHSEPTTVGEERRRYGM